MKKHKKDDFEFSELTYDNEDRMKITKICQELCEEEAKIIEKLPKKKIDKILKLENELVKELKDTDTSFGIVCLGEFDGRGKRTLLELIHKAGLINVEDSLSNELYKSLAITSVAYDYATYQKENEQ